MIFFKSKAEARRAQVLGIRIEWHASSLSTDWTLPRPDGSWSFEDKLDQYRVYKEDEEKFIELFRKVDEMSNQSTPVNKERDSTKTQAKMKVMQAWVDGKDIQVKTGTLGDWSKFNLDREPTWDWHHNQYRISHSTSVKNKKFGTITLPLLVEQDGEGNVISVSLKKE